jgi:hypothetical protein
MLHRPETLNEAGWRDIRLRANTLWQIKQNYFEHKMLTTKGVSCRKLE